MKRIIRLTESELKKIITEVISEAPLSTSYKAPDIASTAASKLGVKSPTIPQNISTEKKPIPKPTYSRPSTQRTDLRYGDYSLKVQQLQKELRFLGYRIGRTGADGKYGPITQDSVKRFQQNNGLRPTGVADVETQKLISKQAKLKYMTDITAQAKTPLDKYSMPGQRVQAPPKNNFVMMSSANAEEPKPVTKKNSGLQTAPYWT